MKIDCPNHCASCNGPICQVCSVGYGLLNGDCVNCPDGTFLDAGNCKSNLLKKYLFIQ